MKNLIAFMVLIFVFSFGGAAVWVGFEKEKMIAPTRLVEGPDGSVYVLSYDKIYAMSSEGRVLKAMDIEEDLGIHEVISDFYVEPDGGLLIGLQDSQTLRIYSPEGNYLRDYGREPSPYSSQETRDFLFTKDPESGTLFVSDSFHHRIQVYNSSEEEIETFTEFFGEKLRMPTGVLFKEGKLYIVDKGGKRIVILNEGKWLEGEVSLAEVTDEIHAQPIRFSRHGNQMVFLTWATSEKVRGFNLSYYDALKLLIWGLDLDHDVYTISPGEEYLGGGYPISEAASIEFQKIYNRTGEDFLDILARPMDILIADPQLMKVLRVSSSGELLGEFGSETLGETLSELRAKRKKLTFAQVGSWVGAILSVLGLIYIGRKEIQG